MPNVAQLKMRNALTLKANQLATDGMCSAMVAVKTSG